jgi:lipid A 3-O-deacylase
MTSTLSLSNTHCNSLPHVAINCPCHKNNIKGSLFMVIGLVALSATAQDSTPLSPEVRIEAPTSLPVLSLPSGFLPPDWNMGFTLGNGFGIHSMGSKEEHDLATASLHVGKILASDEMVSGFSLAHLELAGEFWTGAQYKPNNAYVIGLTPLLRYHIRPAARWEPFIDAGAGVTATDIGTPDLSTTFEFNLQAGVGFHWRFRDNLAFTFESRFLHLSNSGIERPNLGVNAIVLSGGLAWFF